MLPPSKSPFGKSAWASHPPEDEELDDEESELEGRDDVCPT
jgi:hypothetical protein